MSASCFSRHSLEYVYSQHTKIKLRYEVTYLMTWGSSSSIGCVKMGVDVKAEGCGRGAKVGAAPKLG